MFGYRKMYLGGRLMDGAENNRRQVICPANDEAIAEIAWAGKEDALFALDEAKKGFRYWSKLSIGERKKWMLKLRDAVLEEEDLLRRAVLYEMGKTWADTGGDFFMLTDSLGYYAEEMLRLRDEYLPDSDGNFTHRIVKTPIGVVLAFLAWNYPLLNLAYKVGPILAAGCSIIIRPSTESPLSAYIFGEICEKIGFPAGVINIICGPHDSVGDTLVSSQIPAGITLIGSTQTGINLIKNSATSIKHYGMELGGNAPVLIFDDADLDKAVDTVAALKFGNTGQICVAPNRVFVHKKIAQEFTSRIIEKAKALKIGFGRESGATMGPLVNKKARTWVNELVQDAIKNGAHLLYGGKIPDGFDKGAYYMPTILSQVTPAMKIYQEEIFGPVVSIIEFEDEDDVITLANDTDAGLASYVFTKDNARVQKIANILEFGEVQFNGFKYSIDIPHVGIKQSGIGCDCSHLALEDYMVNKRITISLEG